MITIPSVHLLEQIPRDVLYLHRLLCASLSALGVGLGEKGTRELGFAPLFYIFEILKIKLASFDDNAVYNHL